MAKSLQPEHGNNEGVVWLQFELSHVDCAPLDIDIWDSLCLEISGTG
jgi:hypothetical protein